MAALGRGEGVIGDLLATDGSTGPGCVVVGGLLATDGSTGAVCGGIGGAGGCRGLRFENNYSLGGIENGVVASESDFVWTHLQGTHIQARV